MHRSIHWISTMFVNVEIRVDVEHRCRTPESQRSRTWSSGRNRPAPTPPPLSSNNGSRTNIILTPISSVNLNHTHTTRLVSYCILSKRKGKMIIRKYYSFSVFASDLLPRQHLASKMIGILWSTTCHWNGGSMIQENAGSVLCG